MGTQKQCLCDISIYSTSTAASLDLVILTQHLNIPSLASRGIYDRNLYALSQKVLITSSDAWDLSLSNMRLVFFSHSLMIEQLIRSLKHFLKDHLENASKAKSDTI